MPFTSRADGCYVPILRRNNVSSHIVVQGFIIEHGANQWIENFWLPQNAKYSQSGLLGTRSGYRWTIRNNTIRKAQTIGLDFGCEGGYTGSWPPADNEGKANPS